jgi:hypothetical protein
MIQRGMGKERSRRILHEFRAFQLFPECRKLFYRIYLDKTRENLIVCMLSELVGFTRILVADFTVLAPRRKRAGPIPEILCYTGNNSRSIGDFEKLT